MIDVKVNRDTVVPLIGTWHFAPIPQAEPTFGKPLISSSTTTYPSPRSSGQEHVGGAPVVRRQPSVGGVLVEGPSGTGKSTAVRGLAELTPRDRGRRRVPLLVRPGGAVPSLS